jgi:hypothetical protein
MNYKERKAFQRTTLSELSNINVQVQTYRVWADLACWHRTTFTLSEAAYEKGDWKKRRLSCWKCVMDKEKATA